MPRSTLASDPRKGTAHERRTTRKLKRLTPGDTLMLRLCSPLAKHFESQGETLVLGLVRESGSQGPPTDYFRLPDSSTSGLPDCVEVRRTVTGVPLARAVWPL